MRKLKKSARGNLQVAAKVRVKDRKCGVDPKSTCHHAESYFSAHEVLQKHLHEITPLSLSAVNVVLMAFSVECFLKTILLLDKGSFVRSHNLIELFDDLGAENRAALSAHTEKFCAESLLWQSIIRQNPKDKHNIHTFLSDSAESFSKIRYMWEEEHERIPATFGWGLDSVLFSLRKRILEIKPEWVEFMRSTQG